VFTGIVQHLGKVIALEIHDFNARLRIDPCGWSHRPEMGDSIAVNGCCLTIAEEGQDLVFDLILQTLRATMLQDLHAGDLVNLEHAVTPQTLLGGHIVQGHVDTKAQVQQVRTNDGQHALRIPVPDEHLGLISEKGSIAINGVSLTIAMVGPGWFEVGLIPMTLRLTNLGALEPGSPVNLEFDYLAKIVVNHLTRSQPRG